MVYGADVQELEKVLAKIQLYKNESEINTNEIISEIKKINELYSTKNKDKLDDICSDFEDKFTSINREYNESIKRLSDKIDEMKRAEQKIKQTFEDVVVK